MPELKPPAHPPDPRDRTRPVRVFRADAPQEVASASIVAGALDPGFDILAIYAGGSHGRAVRASGRSERALEALRAMAHAHPWSAVVDLTDLPFDDVSGDATSLGPRLARVRATVTAVTGLRRRLAGVLGTAPDNVGSVIDEVYISVLTAGTMMPSYALSPSAKMCCYPHTFTSVNGLEHYQLEYPRSWLGGIADGAKRVVWGPDAVPPRHISIDLAVTYWREPAWASRTVSLSHLVTAETMRGLFEALPGDVRRYFEDLAAECGTPASLLLLAPGDVAPNPAAQDEVEKGAYLRLVARLVESEGANSVIVKPHPRIRPERVEEVVAALRSDFPGLAVVVPTRYPSLPAEVVATPFSLVACGAIISNSLCSLPLIYPMRSYCDQSSAESLYGQTIVRRLLADWRERVPDRIISI